MLCCGWTAQRLFRTIFTSHWAASARARHVQPMLFPSFRFSPLYMKNEKNLISVQSLWIAVTVPSLDGIALARLQRPNCAPLPHTHASALPQSDDTRMGLMSAWNR
jgi:hypothetical protein